MCGEKRYILQGRKTNLHPGLAPDEVKCGEGRLGKNLISSRGTSRVSAERIQTGSQPIKGEDKKGAGKNPEKSRVGGGSANQKAR